MQRFADRVALITGGSRGIGFAIAQRLVDEGRIRRHHGAQAGVARRGARRTRRHGHPLFAGKADDPDHRAAVFAHIAERHGRIDHLVNNAGINPAYGPVLEIDPAIAHKILAVNVLGTLEWTRDAVAGGPQPLGRQPVVDQRAERRAGHRVLRRLEGRRSSTSRSSSRTSSRPASGSMPSRPPSSRPRSRERSTRGARSRSRPATRSPAWANPPTSPVPWRSCCRRTPPGSPARRS